MDDKPIGASEPVDLLYILGPGHCGSTLLNLCLDRHSQVMGVSEIVSLNRNRPGWSGDEDALTTPFWAEVDRVMRVTGDGPLAEVPFNLGVASSDMPRALSLNHAASQAVLSVAGKKILADSSKSPHRLGALLASPLFRVRVIYLVRDGRAVVHAYRRKYGTWFPGWKKLVRIDKAARDLTTKHGNDNWLVIRYEDMASDLEGTLRRVCEFSGISFESAMLKPQTSEFNGVGGNRLRKYPVQDVVLDENWKKEMPKMILAFTSLLVRSFNLRYGYVKL